MTNPTAQPLAVALSDDLNKARPDSFSEVVYDPARKIFRTRKEGAVFEFPFKQPECDFWNGTKTYGSGSSSRIRIQRTQIESVRNSGTPAALPVVSAALKKAKTLTSPAKRSMPRRPIRTAKVSAHKTSR